MGIIQAAFEHEDTEVIFKDSEKITKAPYVDSRRTIDIKHGDCVRKCRDDWEFYTRQEKMDKDFEKLVRKFCHIAYTSDLENDPQ